MNTTIEVSLRPLNAPEVTLVYKIKNRDVNIGIDDYVEVGSESATQPVTAVFFNPHKGGHKTIRLRTILFKNHTEFQEYLTYAKESGWEYQ